MNQTVRGIIKVSKPKYIPKEAKLRAFMGDLIMTAEFALDDYENIKKDPFVVDVVINSVIPLQKAPKTCVMG